jgi:NADPH:quinone reductase-like Zn-dependent oxidoreductase
LHLGDASSRALGTHFSAGVSIDDLVSLERAGVDMVLDVVGAPWTSKNLRVLKREGVIFMVGMQKGKFSDILIGPVYTKQCSIRRTLPITLPLTT